MCSAPSVVDSMTRRVLVTPTRLFVSSCPPLHLHSLRLIHRFTAAGHAVLRALGTHTSNTRPPSCSHPTTASASPFSSATREQEYTHTTYLANTHHTTLSLPLLLTSKMFASPPTAIMAHKRTPNDRTLNSRISKPHITRVRIRLGHEPHPAMRTKKKRA